MRRKLLDTTVAVGTPLITPDLNAEAVQLLVVPASGGTALVERFNTRDANGVPIDLQTVSAQDASSMSAVGSAAAVAARTAVIAFPGCTGLKITASTQSCRVVVHGIVRE